VDNTPPLVWVIHQERKKLGQTAAISPVWDFNPQMLDRLVASDPHMGGEGSGFGGGRSADVANCILKELGESLSANELSSQVAFNAFHDEESAGLSLDDFEQMLIHFSCRASTDQLAKIFKFVSGKRRVIDYAHFSSAMSTAHSFTPATASLGSARTAQILSSSKDGLIDAFSAFDDGGGVVSASDFCAAIEGLALGLSSEEIKQVCSVAADTASRPRRQGIDWCDFVSIHLASSVQRAITRQEDAVKRLSDFWAPGSKAGSKTAKTRWSNTMVDHVETAIVGRLKVLC